MYLSLTCSTDFLNVRPVQNIDYFGCSRGCVQHKTRPTLRVGLYIRLVELTRTKGLGVAYFKMLGILDQKKLVSVSARRVLKYMNVPWSLFYYKNAVKFNCMYAVRLLCWAIIWELMLLFPILIGR